MEINLQPNLIKMIRCLMMIHLEEIMKAPLVMTQALFQFKILKFLMLKTFLININRLLLQIPKY